MGLFSSLFKKETGATTSAIATTDSLNTNKIEDVCFALCWLVGEVGESWVHVVLQDKNEEKNWSEAMEIYAQIDSWTINHLEITSLNTIESYQKLGLPYEIASFLSRIPFEGNYGNLTFAFEEEANAPSTHTQTVLSAMHNGVAKGRKIRGNRHEVTIEDRKGLLVCKVD